MYRFYTTIGVLLLLLLLAVGFVAFAKSRDGVLAWKDVAGSIAYLSVLLLGALLSWWGAFILVGGPDGRFLSSASLGFGALLTAAAYAVVRFALRRLSVSARAAVLLLAPAALAFTGAAVGNWPLALAALTAGPVACLLAIVVLWVRGELRALA